MMEYPKGRVYMLKKERDLEKVKREMAEKHNKLKQEKIWNLENQITKLKHECLQIN